MKVAFTSTDGKTINQGFGKTKLFQIWEIDAEQAVRCATVGALPNHRSKDACSDSRINAVANCKMVCTLEMGNRTMAKLVHRKIYFLRTGVEISIADMIGKLQGILRTNPPPWMRREMAMISAGGPGTRG